MYFKIYSFASYLKGFGCQYARSSERKHNNNSALLSVAKVHFLYWVIWVQNQLQKCFLSVAFFQKQIVAVIQGVAAVVIASIPAVDENVNYKALVECVFILNGECFSVQNAAFYRGSLIWLKSSWPVKQNSQEKSWYWFEFIFMRQN